MPRLGKPLPAATEADLTISPSDIAEAEAAWRRDAPRGFRNLLNAEDAEPEKITTGDT